VVGAPTVPEPWDCGEAIAILNGYNAVVKTLKMKKKYEQYYGFPHSVATVVGAVTGGTIGAASTTESLSGSVCTHGNAPVAAAYRSEHPGRRGFHGEVVVMVADRYALPALYIRVIGAAADPGCGTKARYGPSDGFGSEFADHPPLVAAI
jgi:hypothetical protein